MNCRSLGESFDYSIFEVSQWQFKRNGTSFIEVLIDLPGITLTKLYKAQLVRLKKAYKSLQGPTNRLKVLGGQNLPNLDLPIGQQSLLKLIDRPVWKNS